MIRFHSSAFAFAFAFALVTWAAFCTYVSFCVDFCKFCMTCDVCELCVFCKICEFSVICFALIFFLMFSAFCWINCRMIFSLLFVWLWIRLSCFWIKFSMHSSWSTTRFTCTRCWLRIFCKLCLSEELNNLINIDRAVTALYSCVELTHSRKARQ